MPCTHDLNEMDTASMADGLCPLCQAAENERLRDDLARVLEDRARFPDRPDGVGSMIESHIGNLKHGKEEADKHAIRAMDRCERLLATLNDAKELLRDARSNYVAGSSPDQTWDNLRAAFLRDDEQKEDNNG